MVLLVNFAHQTVRDVLEKHRTVYHVRVVGHLMLMLLLKRKLQTSVSHLKDLIISRVFILQVLPLALGMMESTHKLLVMLYM